MDLERLLRAERAGKVTIKNIGEVEINAPCPPETGYSLTRSIYDDATGAATTQAQTILTISLLDRELSICETSIIEQRALKNAIIALKNKLLLL